MIEFFQEGGWGMWPVLIFAMVTLGASIGYAVKHDTPQLKFAAAMAVTTIVATLHSTALNVGMVFRYLEDRGRAPDVEFSRILVTGLKESLRPLQLAGGLLTLACLLASIGVLRASRKAKG